MLGVMLLKKLNFMNFASLLPSYQSTSGVSRFQLVPLQSITYRVRPSKLPIETFLGLGLTIPTFQIIFDG